MEYKISKVNKWSDSTLSKSRIFILSKKKVNHKYTNIKVEINEPHQHRDMPRQSKLKVQEMEGKQEPSPTSSEEKKSKK